MKKLIFSSLVGFALFSLTGCGEGDKSEIPTIKCEADKCGEGKCGDK
jgi:hypothetical protein